MRRLLAALADVDLDGLRDSLTVPHAYAGGPEWYPLMVEQVVPRLPSRWRSETLRRIDAAADLPTIEPTLVHADLAGDNMRWDEHGCLTGVLDWDLASACDPAVDAACLSWHGWDAVRASVDPEIYERARLWAATFGIEQIGAALVREDPPEVVQAQVEAAVAWLERGSVS
jgi:aminoglycoside phosphotransferase (APT) family kinase protein